MRFSEQKQRCDGGIPHCKRCISGKHNCSYILSQRQIDFARRTKAKIAVAKANSVEQNGSYETALADRSDLTPPGRAIVPRTEAPGPIFGGLTADPQDQPLYYDGFGSGSDTRSTGFFPYPHDSGWAVGGFENSRNGVEPVVQEPDWQSEGLYTRPKEFLNYPQYPGLAFGGLDFSPNDFLRLSQEINFGFGGYPTQLSGPSSFSELGPILETPTTSLNSASLYAQGPGMAFANPTTSSDSSLPAKNKSWVEILFEKHPELFPELQQNPSA